MKKVISMLLSLIMSFGVFMIIPVTTIEALDGISYIDANGKLQTADSVTEMTSNSTALTAGWYAVTSDTEISSRITCTGNVHLILSDDYTLTAPKGITVNQYEGTLTVYGQIHSTGALTINNIHTTEIESAYAAIGGVWTGNGAITINGGVITVVSDACHAAAIGGGNGSKGVVTINGGTIFADMNSGNHAHAAAIGGGNKGEGKVTVNGGTIHATVNPGGFSYGAAIGGGQDSKGEITVADGNITATISSSSFSAAIGGGSQGIGNVTINGGTISASIESENHLSYGAAIGGGGTAGGTILIGTGIVSANSDGYGAGIGAGKNGSADITLGWTKTDDSYSANSYSDSVTLLKAFTDGTDIYSAGSAAPADISGKTLTPVYHTHTLTYHPANAPTVYTAGNSEYWSCELCGRYFSDENGMNQINQDSWIIPALPAAASIGDTLYETFPEAVTAANGEKITLLADISEAYTLYESQTLRIIKGSCSLTVNVPSDNFRLNTVTEGNVTVYTLTPYCAMVGSMKYENFTDAVSAAGGIKEIVLLHDMDDTYSMDSHNYEMLRVIANGHTADISGYAKAKDDGSVTYYYEHEESSKYSGSNFSIVSGTIVVAAGAAATIYVDGPAEEGTGVILGSEASVLIDAEEIDVQPEDANSECIEKTETENGTKYKNLKFAWVRIDTGITIMDAASDILPDCVNDIWDTYNQNTSSIVSILPPVLDILSYTDIKIAFPYPKGWFFPPIPYLPNEMNPGNRFVAFFEDASASSYGTPFIGKIVEDELEIGALWLPQEAAIVSSDGSLTYYDLFTEAASASNGRIIKILKAPLVSYELKRTGSDPAVYETLKVNLGHYAGNCVCAPEDLPQGYHLRSWTYKDSDNEVITCYTVDRMNTVTFVPDNGAENFVQTVYTGGFCSMPENPSRTGFIFDGWYKDVQQTQQYDFASAVYSDFSLYAKWTEMPKYPITVVSSVNGNISVNKEATFEGDTVIVTVEPANGYVLQSLTLIPQQGVTKPITAVDNVYSFVMSAQPVTVKAEFVRKYFVSHSMSLNGDIDINFYLDLTDEEAQSATVDFTWTVEGNTKHHSVVVKDVEKNLCGYKASCPIAAAEMTYDITATLTIEGQPIKTDTYSAVQYADVILTSETFRTKYIAENGEDKYYQLVALVKVMLDYGAKAQKQFHRDEEHPANAKLTDKDKTSPYYYEPSAVDAATIDTGASMMSAGLPDGLTYNGSTIVYLSQTSIRHYYQGNFDNITVTFEGKDVNPVQKGNEFYFELKNIAAADLDKLCTLNINGVDYQYSVLDYVKGCLLSDKTSENMKALAAATYRYNQAANDYFGR